MYTFVGNRRTRSRQRNGSIVNVHSVEGMRGYPGEPVYGAMKAAVAHFKTCLAVEQGRNGIRVNGTGPDLTQGNRMPKMLWKTFATAEPDREYLVLVSSIPAKRVWYAVPMFRGARAVQRQLAQADGLIGLSLLAKPFARQYATLSVWESETALDAFVQQSPHVQLTLTLRPLMSETRFVEWHVQGTDASRAGTAHSNDFVHPPTDRRHGRAVGAGITPASSRMRVGGRCCSVIRTPRCARASSIALVIAGGAASMPPSPTPR